MLPPAITFSILLILSGHYGRYEAKRPEISRNFWLCDTRTAISFWKRIPLGRAGRVGQGRWLPRVPLCSWPGVSLR